MSVIPIINYNSNIVPITQKELIINTNGIFPAGPIGPTGATGPIGETGPIGPTGRSISAVEKISTSDLVDTYRISFNDNTYFDYEIKNGKSLYLNFEVSVTTGDLYVDFLDD